MEHYQSFCPFRDVYSAHALMLVEDLWFKRGVNVDGIPSEIGQTSSVALMVNYVTSSNHVLQKKK